jgi:hypothetical protein
LRYGSYSTGGSSYFGSGAGSSYFGSGAGSSETGFSWTGTMSSFGSSCNGKSGMASAFSLGRAGHTGAVTFFFSIILGASLCTSSF